MPARRRNPQLFALPAGPPERIELGGAGYRIVRVYKHDFWAATCLYEAEAPTEVPRAVVKFGRSGNFCGAPLGFAGRFLRDREEAIYARLAGLEGVPRWLGRLGDAGCAIEHIDAVPLDHVEDPPPGFFDRLRVLFDAVHARGVGYCDANKRSNILVGPAGEPYLVDFQISVRERPDLPGPLRALASRLVSYVRDRDLYHLYKHKRRMVPERLTPAEDALSRKRGRLHRLHRAITKPYRAIRRSLLRRRHERGQLTSPTEALEDHHQPEKATWRASGNRRLADHEDETPPTPR